VCCYTVMLIIFNALPFLTLGIFLVSQTISAVCCTIEQRQHKSLSSFIDYKKVFDSVKHSRLWKMLKDMGLYVTMVDTSKRTAISTAAGCRYSRFRINGLV